MFLAWRPQVVYLKHLFAVVVVVVVVVVVCVFILRSATPSKASCTKLMKPFVTGPSQPLTLSAAPSEKRYFHFRKVPRTDVIDVTMVSGHCLR